VVIIVLGSDAETWVYQLVIGFGAALGFYNGIVVSGVPESDSPRRSAQKPLGEVLRRVWRQGSMRRLLFAWAAGFAAFTLVLPFAIITLKNGYGLTDQNALIFSLIALCGGTVSGIVNGVIADHVGPRPLMVLYMLLLLLVALYWAFAFETLLLIPTGIAFFVAGYAKYGILMMSGHYFLSIAVETDRVGSSMVLRAISGAIAGLVGSIIGGGLLGVLNGMGLEGMATYRTYFRLILVAFLILIPTVYALHRLSEWPLRKTAILHFRLRRIAKMKREQRSNEPSSPHRA
jgi:nitrate/nitrite transporter NarK